MNTFVGLPLAMAHPMTAFLTVAAVPFTVEPQPDNTWTITADSEPLDAAHEYAEDLNKRSDL